MPHLIQTRRSYTLNVVLQPLSCLTRWNPQTYTYSGALFCTAIILFLSKSDSFLIVG